MIVLHTLNYNKNVKIYQSPSMTENWLRITVLNEKTKQKQNNFNLNQERIMNHEKRRNGD